MNIQHAPSQVSIMPEGHLCFWKYLYNTLPNDLIVAGSFATVQMRENLHGSRHKYNDIDIWYDEDHDNYITVEALCTAASKLRIMRY